MLSCLVRGAISSLRRLSVRTAITCCGAGRDLCLIADPRPAKSDSLQRMECRLGGQIPRSAASGRMPTAAAQECGMLVHSFRPCDCPSIAAGISRRKNDRGARQCAFVQCSRRKTLQSPKYHPRYIGASSIVLYDPPSRFHRRDVGSIVTLHRTNRPTLRSCRTSVNAGRIRGQKAQSY